MGKKIKNENEKSSFNNNDKEIFQKGLVIKSSSTDVYTNPDEQFQSKKDFVFQKIEEHIKTLPLNKKGKDCIWYVVYVDFWDSLNITGTDIITNGIQTIDQLKKYVENFILNVRKLKKLGIEAFLKNINEKPIEDQKLDIIEFKRRFQHILNKAKFDKRKIDLEFVEFVENTLAIEKESLNEKLEMEKFKLTKKLISLEEYQRRTEKIIIDNEESIRKEKEYKTFIEDVVQKTINEKITINIIKTESIENIEKKQTPDKQVIEKASSKPELKNDDVIEYNAEEIVLKDLAYSIYYIYQDEINEGKFKPYKLISYLKPKIIINKNPEFKKSNERLQDYKKIPYDTIIRELHKIIKEKKQRTNSNIDKFINDLKKITKIL
jgi:hypothetical protein